MGERINVLHVDDDPKFTKITDKFLRKESAVFETVAETRVADALDHLGEDTDIDCVVSDYALPDMDGIEFLETVREEHPRLPFIIFTGRGSESVASKALAGGATDYLQKRKGTEQYSLLANRVRNAVEQYQSHQEREKAERYRQELYRITSDTSSSFEEKIERLLRTGCDRLGVENGHVTRIDRDADRHEVTMAAGSDIIQSGTVSELHETYCQETITTDDILTVYNAPRDGWEDETAYERWDIGCYIGGKIEVGSDLYGTVCFVDQQPRSEPFTEEERSFVDLVTRWLSQTFERRERERELEQYEAVTEAVSDVIVIVDEDGHIRSVNPAVEDVLGYEPDGLPGEPVTRLMPPAFEAAHLAAFERYVETGERQLDWEYIEFPGRHQEGHDVPLAVSFTEFEHGGDHFFAGVLRDITERRRREQRLKRYEGIINRLPVGVFRSTTDGEFQQVNRAFVSLMGAESEEELLRADPSEFYANPEKREKLVDRLQREGTVSEEEMKITRLDGEDIWVSTTLTLAEVDGEQFLEGISQDITERKRQEQKLEEVEVKYRQLIEQNLVGVYLIQDGEFKYVNRHLAEIFGETPDEMVGRPPYEWIVEGDHDRVAENIRRRLEGEEESLQFTVRCRRTDGTEITVEVDGGRVETDGRPAILGTLRDVTDG